MDVPEPHVPWLEALAPSDAEAFRALCRGRRYGPGVVLFHHGDEPGAVAAILGGWVKLMIPGRQGKDVILGFVGPGELLGDVAALDGRPRSATAQAVDAVHALLVTRVAFEHFVTERPSVALALMRSLARRLRSADAQQMEFAAYDVVGRVAQRLVDLCDEHGEPHERGVLAGLALSQDELAAWTASSREAVAKSLQILRGLGWIETHRRRIVVLDLGALRDYAR
jgi:CRP/FNR family transcriptional regulator, cyclic AMP receptor protein